MMLQSAATDVSRVSLYALYLALVDFGYLVWLTLRVRSGLDKLEQRMAELEKKR